MVPAMFLRAEVGVSEVVEADAIKGIISWSVFFFILVPYLIIKKLPLLKIDPLGKLVV
jgi:hypothetical protein